MNKEIEKLKCQVACRDIIIESLLDAIEQLGNTFPNPAQRFLAEEYLSDCKIYVENRKKTSD